MLITFNSVNELMFNFSKGMFNPTHKSYYHKDDMNIFSMAHTIAPIDTVRIPVFSEFDSWKKYDYQICDFSKINSFTLYFVKSKVRNILLNRT